MPDPFQSPFASNSPRWAKIAIYVLRLYRSESSYSLESEDPPDANGCFNDKRGHYKLASGYLKISPLDANWQYHANDLRVSARFCAREVRSAGSQYHRRFKG